MFLSVEQVKLLFTTRYSRHKKMKGFLSIGCDVSIVTMWAGYGILSRSL